jgi:hypothetical protein
VPLYQQIIGDALGQLKVEATADDVIVVGYKLYWMGNARYRSCGTPHATIEATGNIRRWYEARLN